MAILTSTLRQRPTQPGLNLASIVDATAGYSGADLAGLIETATDMAIDDSLSSGGEPTPISGAHLLRSLEETRPTTADWLTTARNYAKYADANGLYDDVLTFLRGAASL
jgi:SpoVK/Ycf46/Vps4 family AAA+-type ATPase